MYGAEWFIDHKDTKLKPIEIMTPVYRFANAILGTNNNRTDIRSTSKIPDHFNYTVNNKLGKSYIKDYYAVITEFDKQMYDTVWKDVGRFNKEDFEKLETDSSVDKLYSNGGDIVWYIHANLKAEL